jgi:hypothetical protein
MNIHAAEYWPDRTAPNRDQGVYEPTDQHGDDENEQRPAQRRAVIVERTLAVHAQKLPQPDHDADDAKGIG